MKDSTLHYFWRVWVNEEGESCQTRNLFKNHEKTIFAMGTSPIWSAVHYSGAATIITLLLMPKEVKNWHENPKPQWIIPLKGRWGVETMDGMVVEMGPGDISFGGDQGTRGRQGHRSWAIGDTPVELLLIPGL
ncbi:cupin domain-containing protein [Synechococcus sp. BIOS-E4-1]|uniref:cupin domain-containing protein n=1 Tax=Synechococcus sp. BIOS-E4-1 TaxID=1400864 RepID=UPI0021033730|nr:cupin domain-containing protein [Synechococcus sp. BIOS-E4-1]